MKLAAVDRQTGTVNSSLTPCPRARRQRTGWGNTSVGALWTIISLYMGFDPIEEVVQKLVEANKGHPIGITTAWPWETPTGAELLLQSCQSDCQLDVSAGRALSRRPNFRSYKTATCR